MSKCVVRFSDGILKWVCDVHNEPGGCDEYGCLQGAREYIAELEAKIVLLMGETERAKEE